MKRPKNFDKIDRAFIKYTVHSGSSYEKVEHFVDMETIYLDDMDTDGIFVMTDDNQYKNVLYFRIHWNEWVGNTYQIKVGIVPQAHGTRAIHHIDTSISIKHLLSKDLFAAWITNICQANDLLLKNAN